MSWINYGENLHTNNISLEEDSFKQKSKSNKK